VLLRTVLSDSEAYVSVDAAGKLDGDLGRNTSTDR